MMKFFNIPVNVVVYAKDLEEAQLKANLFMPWTTNGDYWNIEGHKYLNGYQIDQWNIDGVDSDEMEGKLRKLGYR
jgi:hypothetical protein